MPLLCPLVLPTHVRRVGDFVGLLVIRTLGVNLALWERTVPTALEHYLDHCIPTELPDTRFGCRGDQIADAIRDEVHACADDPLGRQLLVADLVQLGSDYARLVDSGRLSVRIERIDTDLCTKYHCDASGLRLLSTYRGPGTCWVPNNAVRRDRMGQYGDNLDIVPDPTLVQQFPRFAVGLLKGEGAGKGHHDPAIVHRSPSIYGTGHVRLLFCLEPWSPNHGH